MGASWFSRATESIFDQLVASGAAGSWGADPIDGDIGFKRLGEPGRQVPYWTLEKSRAYSVNSYRANPLGRSIIDTITSFAVGDSGVTVQCPDPEVNAVVQATWTDHRNKLSTWQDAYLRDHLLMGETILENMVGQLSGVVRLSVIDPSRVDTVSLRAGNPLWLDQIGVRVYDSDGNGSIVQKSIVQVDDLTGLRMGEVHFWPSFRALLTDRRGVPFLAPILDDLEAYSDVLSNLIDRTALARHLVYHYKLKGADQTTIDKWVKDRGNQHIPRSGSIEVTNDSVEIDALSPTVGAAEDSITSKSVMTNIAAGAGLAKTWLAEPEDANRATSLTMAEPVRRRVGAVQNLWLANMQELLRYAVDQAVAVGRLPAQVESRVPGAPGPVAVPTSSIVRVTGPEIAAADAEINATILDSLSKSLTEAVVAKLCSPEAARLAWQKGWEQFVGRPWTSDLDPMQADVDALADELDGAQPAQVTLKLA